MRIIEANIINFGKFKDRVFTFENGFNIVKGDNESGKSTLLAFIKFALYGVGRKNPSVAVGERERALSWNVGIAAGSLTVADVDGHLYRIERSGREGARGAYVDKVRIIDLENGEEVFIGEIPGEHFLGIDAQAYDSMCNIKQLEAVAVGAGAVKGAIDNLLSSGDESTSIQAAIKMLDTERRRLLHTNGRGGLVYEMELELSRLKSDHRSALIFENECIKNRDELERVELSLAKAKSEFEVAQRMCDVHDDVLRLQRFEELASLKSEVANLEEESAELDKNANCNISRASHDVAARLKNAANLLSESTASLESAKMQLESTKRALEGASPSSERGFEEIISEFGTPTGAIAHLGAKKKKKNDASLKLVLFGIAFALLIAFAVVLLIGNNMYGAATVAFIGIIAGALALSSYKKYSSAKAEIGAFMSKMGDGFCPKDEQIILNALQTWVGKKEERERLENALNKDEAMLSIATRVYQNEFNNARTLWSEFGNSSEIEDHSDALLALAQTMSEYLSKRSALDSLLREKRALIKSLSTELERFSEADIRTRITPEIKEKIKGTSFEKLKAERDAALYKSNQFNQYKAGIERNIAASERTRSSADIFPEIGECEQKLDTLKLRLDAVKLAMETIDVASREMKSDVTPKIKARAQENLALMTVGKYNELFIDENMGLSVFTEGATRPIDSLSRGSLDVAYFAVRLTLLQVLLADKEPPLYMDEVLSQLDDGRAENVLRAIAKHSESAQSVLFTCQNRDIELASRITNVNLIEI